MKDRGAGEAGRDGGGGMIWLGIGIGIGLVIAFLACVIAVIIVANGPDMR